MIAERIYRNSDYQRIINFLRDMYNSSSNQHCWLPMRLEYAEHLVNPLYIERGHDSWHNYINIWEERGRIVGIAHPEEESNAYLQIRPGYRHLEREMITWIEDNISERSTADGCREVFIWANDSDEYRQNILRKRGYIREDECSYLNIQELDCPGRPAEDFQPELPDDYNICTMVDDIAPLKRYNVLRKAFHPGKEDKSEIPASFLQMLQAPMYKPELDILVRKQDGQLAASCLVWYDENINMRMFEPVGTHPDHQRKGLGRAAMLAGLQKLKTLGAEKAYVESFGEERYSFYKSAGFRAYDRDYPWKKQFK